MAAAQHPVRGLDLGGAGLAVGLPAPGDRLGAAEALAAGAVRVELTALGKAVGVVGAAAVAADHLDRTAHDGASADVSRPDRQPTESLHA